MHATRRQKVLCGALGSIAVLVLLYALALQGRTLGFWDSHRFQSEIASSGIKLSEAVPPIEAVIQSMKSEDRLVVLSIGMDQKVQEGQVFVIHRTGKFVGIVRAIKVYDDLAGARILFTRAGESIQVGDQASTRP
jgi:hypothetical protein